MPKSTEDLYRDGQRVGSREVGQDEDALVKGKAQDAKGLGSKVKGTAFTPPRMNPGEGASAYSARVAAARREFDAAAAEGQKAALKNIR